MIQFAYLGLIIASICFQAMSHGIIDRTRMRNHLLQVLMVVSFLGITTLMYYSPINIFNVLISYLFMRIGLFNFVYNEFREIDSFYAGNTEIFDRLLRSIPSRLAALILVSFVNLGIVAIFFNF